MSPEETLTTVVVTASSVDEAIILGLTRLVATRDEVEIEILDEGSRGFLGIGIREARVQVTRRAQATMPDVAEPVVPQSEPEPVISVPQPAVSPEPKHTPVATAPKPETTIEATPPAEKATVAPEPVAPTKPAPTPKLRPVELQEKPRTERPASTPDSTLDRALVEKTALEVAENLFAGFNIQCSVSWEQEDRPALWISLRGKDADVMVGPRAQTLDSVQYLFRTLLHRLAEGDYNVVLDADGYRKRRQRSLEALARKMADQAIKSGRNVRMKPMPAHERRVIHMVLRKDKRVKTESTGRGHDRAITIMPNKKEN
jgi:spoIIIJ-associated protein